MLILLMASPVCAWEVGYINSDGYVWDGTYWSYSGFQYTRLQQAYQVYYPGNCGSYQTYKWVYTPYHAPVAVAVVGTDEIIANAVAARDKLKNQIVQETLKHQQFIEKIKAANLDKDIGLNYSSQLLGNGSLLTGNFGINTSAIWGYNQSLAQVIDPYKINLDQALLLQSQITQGSNDANAQVNKAFSDSINLAFNRSADLSGIAARTNAHVQFAKILEGPPGSATVSISPDRTVTIVKSQPPGDLAQRWNQSVTTSCINCHYGTKGERKDGGFSVADFPNMDIAAKQKVVARLEIPVGQPGHMPKGAPALSLEEYKAWVEVAALPPNVTPPPQEKKK